MMMMRRAARLCEPARQESCIAQQLSALEAPVSVDDSCGADSAAKQHLPARLVCGRLKKPCRSANMLLCTRPTRDPPQAVTGGKATWFGIEVPFDLNTLLAVVSGRTLFYCIIMLLFRWQTPTAPLTVFEGARWLCQQGPHNVLVTCSQTTIIMHCMQ